MLIPKMEYMNVVAFEITKFIPVSGRTMKIRNMSAFLEEEFMFFWEIMILLMKMDFHFSFIKVGRYFSWVSGDVPVEYFVLSSTQFKHRKLSEKVCTFHLMIKNYKWNYETHFFGISENYKLQNFLCQWTYKKTNSVSLKNIY